MSRKLGLHCDEITARLAADRLRSEGIATVVVADDDLLGVAGTPTRFSLLVPDTQLESARQLVTTWRVENSVHDS